MVRSISGISTPGQGEPCPAGAANHHRRLLLGAPPLALAVMLAGCGSASPTANSTNTPPSSPPPAVAAVTVKTATVAVNGSSETVFTDAAGRTLYYFTPDTPTKIACTSTSKLPSGQTCTTVWPPLTTSASAVNTPVGTSGSFTIYKGADGSQVEYNGHPLYTFSGDTGPDQSHGEGLLGKWFVATPSLTPTAAASPAASPSSSSGGYSY